MHDNANNDNSTDTTNINNNTIMLGIIMIILTIIDNANEYYH